MKTIDVAILAGGLGTRISHVLKDTPKLLAPVCGKPFLDILVEWLAGFGVRRVILGLGHLAPAVIGHLEDSHTTGLDIVPVVETNPLGTAGALRFLRHKVESDPLLIINGDSFVGADLCAFVASHKASGAEASLLCVEMDDTSRYGRVEVTGEGKISGFMEKSVEPAPGLISAGVYLFGSAMLSRIEASNGPSLERDIFQTMPPGSLHAMTGRFPFVDIGTPESLLEASEVVMSCLNR